MQHSHSRGMSPFKAGAIALVFIVAVTYLAFAKHVPFVTHHYQLKAVFSNSANIRPSSTVRIAGVDVGKVKSVSAYKDASGEPTGAALVTMELDNKALPIHQDATLKIRPKLFLEGNFFVQVDPGSPSAANVSSGGTIPVTQTSAPVQIDQVLSSLQADTRSNLQTLVKGYGDALNGKPLPADDLDQVPAVRGLTAAQALNKSLDHSAQALRGSSLVNQGLLGVDIHDLSRLVRGTQRVSAALNANEGVLQDFVVNFNRTTQAFANQQDNLQQSVALLGPVVQEAGQTFTDLNASLPGVNAWATAILPGVRETGPTIDAAFPWVEQTRQLVSPAELQGLVNELRPTVANLASVTDESLNLIPQLDLLNRCAIDVVLPTGDIPIKDGFLTTGVPNYKEAWQAIVGLSSESQNFDGNGIYTRFQAGGGAVPVNTGPSPSGILYGNATAPILGTQPKRPAAPPPKKTNVACYKNALPNLDNAPIGSGPVRTAIRKHLRDFLAIIFLIVVAAGVASYVLANERLYLPSWVPFIGSSFYKVNAEFSTAQAVVPGQGQTVNIAGVPIGNIGNVTLRNGVAVVQMNIKKKYEPIYKNAQLLLRPKTGLKDMYIEMDPGTSSAGAVPAGGTIPVSNTLPDVNLDEILSNLDSDTRSYLIVLLGAGAQTFGTENVSADLRNTFKRFEPTASYTERITRLLAQRRRALRRVIHNFQLVTSAVAVRDHQLTQFVDSANANFAAISSQDQKLEETLQLLPGTLSTANEVLPKLDDLAKVLGPTFQSLVPGAKALGPSLKATHPFLKQTTPVIQNQLRPFSRDVQPTVHQLRLASQHLAPTAPRLTSSATFLNTLFNELAYNPPGSQEGYLYWLSWLNHAGASLFSTQDANGALRRGIFMTDCGSLTVVQTLQRSNPQLGVILDLLNAPKPATACARTH